MRASLAHLPLATNYSSEEANGLFNIAAAHLMPSVLKECQPNI
jgi:hypothetical protein